jgi:phosphoglycolate phosphatase
VSSLVINGEEVLNHVDAIIFDKDGTLIDVHHYWSSMIKIRASKVVDKWFNGSDDDGTVQADLIDVMGVDLTSDKLRPHGPVGVKSRGFVVNVVKDCICNNGVFVDNDAVELLFKDVDSITAENLSPLLKILPGVEQLLEKMSRFGVKAVIASTDITNRAVKAMEILGLRHHFVEIFGGDSVRKTKPAPDLVMKVIRVCDFNSKNVVVIGDHPVDIEMGLSANVGSNIGVLTGLSDAESFNDLNCIVIDDLSKVEIRR